jgi:membrane-bound metal-dependent hydrolase YbcI (DUF457 family)
VYAVGHLALGYLTGRVAGNVLKVRPNLSLLFLASVIPDFDLLIPGVEHRGPTHSLIVFILLFIPAFLFSGKKAVPYFVALTQHALLGDYITGGTQLLWPLTTQVYGTGMPITSPINLLLEGSLFLVSMVVLVHTRDLWLLFRRDRTNLLLSTPLLTVLLPAFLRFPTYVPLVLLAPHLVYLTLFALSIAMDVKALLAN